MRLFILLLVASIKGFFIGAGIGLALQLIVGLAVGLGVVKTMITLAVATAIWRFRVGLVRMFVILPMIGMLRAFHWVCAPVLARAAITNRSSSFDR